jgi:hypothetical protein
MSRVTSVLDRIGVTGRYGDRAAAHLGEHWAADSKSSAADTYFSVAAGQGCLMRKSLPIVCSAARSPVPTSSIPQALPRRRLPLGITLDKLDCAAE